MRLHLLHSMRPVAAAALLVLLCAPPDNARPISPADQAFEYADTMALVSLVNDTPALVRRKGDAAFADLRAGGRWRQGDTYIFVLDPGGTMLVHPEREIPRHAARVGRHMIFCDPRGGSPGLYRRFVWISRGSETRLGDTASPRARPRTVHSRQA